MDIRNPLGGLFLVFGLLLLGYGLMSDPQIYRRSLGVNLNLWCGIAMAFGGAISLYLARRRRIH
jgi:hypothetical protein